MKENKNKNKKKKKKVYVLFPHAVAALERRIANREEPRERLYGFFELKQRDDVEVQFSDHRHSGLFFRLVSKLNNYGLNPLHPLDIAPILKADVVVIKDIFSFSTSILCKVIGKRVIYYDSMFTLSKSKIKNILIKYCLLWAKKVICYSRAQAELYSTYFDVDIGKFEVIDFALDPEFYVTASADLITDRSVLSVGRDLGRDFRTLVEAVVSADYELDLVTLPYLIADLDLNSPNVRVHQRIPYEELFALYEQASVVVIPLKEGLSYPSGIRAVLEAIALKRPVIISCTDYVRANIPESKVLTYVRPESVGELREAIRNCSFDFSDEDFAAITPSYDDNIRHVIKNIVEPI